MVIRPHVSVVWSTLDYGGMNYPGHHLLWIYGLNIDYYFDRLLY